MSKQHDNVAILGEQGGAVKKVMLAALAALLLVSSLIPGLAAPAKAQTQEPTKTTTGPINPDNGFPYWYQDNEDTRLELCQNEDLCLLELPNPGEPISFPDNFGGEQFWWSGEAQTTTNTGSDALLVLAMEAAFANEDPVDGDQMSFGRVRIRIDDLVAGKEYKVTYPYGEKIFEATPTDTDPVTGEPTGPGEINVTEDIGCFPGARVKCDWDEANFSKIGPFLKWDQGAPEDYVGDPTQDHAVIGSAVPNTDASIEDDFQNYFKVESLNADGEVAEQVAFTDQFAVSGKLAELRVAASPARGTVFNDPAQKVELVSSDPEAEIRYTTDPADVVADADIASLGEVYNKDQKITLPEGETMLRFVAVKGEQQTDPVTKTYLMDTAAPNVTAQSIDSDADPADPNVVVNQGAGAYDKPQLVTLKANEPADIYYTTDGSDPANRDSAKKIAYDPDNATPETILVERTRTIRAIAVDVSIDPDTGERTEIGNTSQPKSLKYIIASLAAKGPINPATGSGQNGFPFWYKDANGVKLDLCLDPQDQKCLVPFEMPDPNGEVSFPDNFPGEQFWWAGEADLNVPGSKKALLVMAQEAAFANDEVVDGDQMSFGRIRIRIDGLRIGQEYTVTHPYGVDTFTAEDDGKGGGEINVTEDLGCFPGPNTRCDFDEARFGRVGPFLTWDTFGQGTDANLAGVDAEGNPLPDAYVGDPGIPHTVTGSPYNTNYFKIEGPNVGGPGINFVQSDEFAISGKVAKFQVGINHPGGTADDPQTFNQPKEIVLGASEEAAQIYATTNGENPDPANNNQLYEGPLTIDSDTTLKYMAVLRDPVTNEIANETPVYTEVYTIDAEPPAKPTIELDAASDSGAKGDNITNDTTPTFIGQAEAGSTVRILAGNNARGSAKADAEGNYSVTTSLLNAGNLSITAQATDLAGNPSERSDVLNLRIDTTVPTAPTADPAGGTFTTANAPTVTLSAQEGEIHYTQDASEPTEDSPVYTEGINVNDSRTISAIVIDEAGNTSPESSWTYVINSPNTRPTINVLSPAPGSALRDRTPTIRARVLDAQTDLARANIRVQLDGSQVNFTYDRARNLVTFTPRNRLAFGRHTVRIVATDADGARTPSSWAFRIVRR